MIALLPMKGNSERVPKKNIREMNGKPLFFYIGDTLKKVSNFEFLAINTDCEVIANMAKKRYGAWVKIIERPKRLIGDEIPMNLIIEHDISKIGINNDYFQTHSTSPLISTKTIKEAIKLYDTSIKSGLFDSVFSANTLNVRLYDKNLSPINHKSGELIRTQDLDVVYEENSCFYIFSGKSFIENKHRIGKTPKVFEMDRSSFETVDIDRESDWDFVMKILQANLA